MQRYFVKDDAWDGDVVTLTETMHHHIKNVMRMEIGAELICSNPEGDAAICVIQSIEANQVQVTVKEWLEAGSELPVQVTIAQGIPKKNKLEWILQKGTELGASRFSLYQGDRSVVKWDKKKQEQRLTRYQKIVQESAEQSHRNLLPDTVYHANIQEVIKNEYYDLLLFAYEEEAKKTGKEKQTFGKLLKSCEPGTRICILIGPEGGFSAEEAAFIIEAEGQPIRLGPRILRTETASLYALASISYHFEELRCK